MFTAILLDDISTPSGSSYSNHSESADEDDDAEDDGDIEGGKKISGDCSYESCCLDLYDN